MKPRSHDLCTHSCPTSLFLSLVYCCIGVLCSCIFWLIACPCLSFQVSRHAARYPSLPPLAPAASSRLGDWFLLLSAVSFSPWLPFVPRLLRILLSVLGFLYPWGYKCVPIYYVKPKTAVLLSGGRVRHLTNIQHVTVSSLTIFDALLRSYTFYCIYKRLNPLENNFDLMK